MQGKGLARGAALAVVALLQVSIAPFLGAQISSAQAQDAAAFFKGRNVNMEIGYSAGGGYDVYARMIARFMGKHIPGAPAVIPKNMQGAGSLRLANWLYTAATKDGTEIGTIGRGIAFDPLLGNKNAQFDAAKFTWLGSATNEVSVCVAWQDSGIAKFDDLYTKPMAVGGTGLYLRALQHGLAAIPSIPTAIREEAAALHRALGGAAFRERLAALDPAAAARLPPGDRQRLMRAWEVVYATGRPIGDWQAGPAAALPYRFASILLAPPREALCAACDARFLGMIAAGALDEAAALAARGLDPELPAMKGVGVPELLRHLRGDVALDEAVAAAQLATRRYAKRQMTWFRHQMVPDLVLNAQLSESLLRCSRHFIDQFLLTGRV